MRINARIAILVTIIVMSASSVVAQNAQLVDWPSGDVWISEPEAQAPLRNDKKRVVPQILPTHGMSDGQNAAPAEFNFNITLTLRPNGRRGSHAGQAGRASSNVHHGPRHRFHADSCRG